MPCRRAGLDFFSRTDLDFSWIFFKYEIVSTKKIREKSGPVSPCDYPGEIREGMRDKSGSYPGPLPRRIRAGVWACLGAGPGGPLWRSSGHVSGRVSGACLGISLTIRNVPGAGPLLRADYHYDHYDYYSYQYYYYPTTTPTTTTSAVTTTTTTPTTRLQLRQVRRRLSLLLLLLLRGLLRLGLLLLILQLLRRRRLQLLRR